MGVVFSVFLPLGKEFLPLGKMQKKQPLNGIVPVRKALAHEEREKAEMRISRERMRWCGRNKNIQSRKWSS